MTVLSVVVVVVAVVVVEAAVTVVVVVSEAESVAVTVVDLLSTAGYYSVADWTQLVSMETRLNF